MCLLYFRRELDINGWEDLDGIASMTGNILNLINDITSTWKIDSSNIYLGNISAIITTGFTLTAGGFSQGGHLALHAAYQSRVVISLTYPVELETKVHPKVRNHEEGSY